MLYFETVEPSALAILEMLTTMPELKAFSLVGGTALSLLYGHRKSIDLDLLSSEKFENGVVSKALKKKFKEKYIYEAKQPKFGLFCYLDGIKVDIVRVPDPIIRPIQTIDDVRMYSTEDIIAMKVQAVLNRARKKDFWDIAELLNYYSVQDFIDFHRKKYESQSLLISVPQAITYFADAEDSEDPVSLKKQTWPGVQKIISKKVKEYLK